MHELYELKEKLCRELKQYNEKELTKETLDVIDKLSHATKNLDKIIEKYEEEEAVHITTVPMMVLTETATEEVTEEAIIMEVPMPRGRGRNAKRDNMGRYASDNGYSRHSGVVEELREMMMDAPNDEIRRDYEKIISRIESEM